MSNPNQNPEQIARDKIDAFLIGLTATPDKRTFGFFNENVVSEYTYEQSVIDGVNVPQDVYHIETDITKNGAVVESGWYVDRRDKLTREKRWQQEDETTEYTKKDLDKNVVNLSQIRNVIREFKDALQTKIYPNRVDENGEYEVPKTLVFAKTDSHADDIITIIREEFDEGNDFCKKVTYKAADDPKSVLNRFRNAYYPRIAVTVDMIATGTDVKPLEVLLFMRDVRSTNYFEQMKGRGTRTIQDDSLKMVSRTAEKKTHFVIVDAVGVTKSKKTDSRPLERKRGIPLKDLLGAITMGAADEDLFLSLANRVIRLDKQLTEPQQAELEKLTDGKQLKQITKSLISAYDPDAIEQRAKVDPKDPPGVAETKKQTARQELITEAATVFNGKLNEFLDNARRQLDQIIDHHNIDTVTHSDWEAGSEEKAQALIADFPEYLETHKDEIKALSIFYNQPYNRREVTIQMIKAVMDKLRMDKPTLAPAAVWNACAAIEKVKGDRPKDELTALVSLIRRACGIDSELKAFDKTIDENFKNWMFKQNAGQHNRFNAEQMEWLRRIKDHVVHSYHIELDDLDYTPFDAKGGRRKMHQLFGDDMTTLINELNEVLAA